MPLQRSAGSKVSRSIRRRRRGPSSRNSWCACRRPRPRSNARLREQHGIIGGYDLGGEYPHLKDHMLIAVTELNTRAGIDQLVMALRRPAT